MSGEVIQETVVRRDGVSAAVVRPRLLLYPEHALLQNQVKVQRTLKWVLSQENSDSGKDDSPTASPRLSADSADLVSPRSPVTTPRSPPRPLLPIGHQLQLGGREGDNVWGAVGQGRTRGSSGGSSDKEEGVPGLGLGALF